MLSNTHILQFQGIRVMKTTTLAATAFAMSGFLLLDEGPAFAKGPLGIGEQQAQSPLVLVKETPTTIDMKDFPWGLEEGRSENLRMTFQQQIPNPEGDEPVALDYTVTIPWMEVEKDGDDTVRITMDEQLMTMSLPGDDGEVIEFNIDMLYDNLDMSFTRDGDRMKFAGTADGMAASLDSPQLADEEIELTYKIIAEGLNITGEGAAEQDWTDMRALDIAYEYSLDSMDLDLKVAGDGTGGQNLSVLSTFGKTVADGKIGQGILSSNAEVQDFKLNVAEPMPMDVSAAKMAVGVTMPTEPSPKPQDIKYLLAFEGINLSDQIWAMADPGEAFPRDLKKLVIDLEMKAMMMVSLLDPGAMAEAEKSGMPPLIPTSATINSIAFDGLGLKVDATGAGELKGMTPEGSAYVTVYGLSDFVASAQKAGMFGEQEAMMVEGMAGQLGKPGDDGELIFDIKTDGGMLNINGAPVMPLPGAQ